MKTQSQLPKSIYPELKRWYAENRSVDLKPTHYRTLKNYLQWSNFFENYDFEPTALYLLMNIVKTEIYLMPDKSILIKNKKNTYSLYSYIYGEPTITIFKGEK